MFHVERFVQILLCVQMHRYKGWVRKGRPIRSCLAGLQVFDDGRPLVWLQGDSRALVTL